MATKLWFDDAFPADAPLVILHPNFTNQHLLLSAVLGQQRRTTIVFNLLNSDSDLNTVWALFSAALSEQQDITLANLDAKATPDKAAQIALKHLKPLGDFLLVIDSFDLANEMVEAWVAGMVKNLPDGSQILLSGRRLPLSLVRNELIQGKVSLHPRDPERMLLDYMHQPTDQTILEIYGLGTGRAFINGRPIDKWDGMLPRSLFFYFIDRGMVTRDEIFQTFWPNLSVREATNVFHVTKRKISEILGFDLTIYWSGFYRISPDVNLHYDVVKFVEHVQNSVVADDNTAIELLQCAIYLYQGKFLSTLDMDWATSRRSELNLIYVDALSSLGKLRQRQNRPEEALGLYLRAAASQPHREDLARGIMSLFTELGQPNKALESYERLVNELKRSLDVVPDRRTIELAERIRAQIA